MYWFKILKNDTLLTTIKMMRIFTFMKKVIFRDFYNFSFTYYLIKRFLSVDDAIELYSRIEHLLCYWTLQSYWTLYVCIMMRFFTFMKKVMFMIFTNFNFHMSWFKISIKDTLMMWMRYLRSTPNQQRSHTGFPEFYFALFFLFCCYLFWPLSRLSSFGYV